MIQALAVGGMIAALLLAVWTGVQAGRRRPTTEAQMIGAIVVEAVLVVQAVIATVRVAGGATVVEPVTFLAYLFGVLLPLPLGFYLAREERSRWGSLSLCFTAVVVGVMTLRLLQLWSAGRA
ncbi:hypothetical protein JL107_18310 [Nakamurella flavida]|uniref:Uncharacterized protein n=1 Tax=Nakamurella flavida TaxID=363630 RepID=A0A938YS33_9ACTN|nr:hypothetical protein [Nakamurella flavida]MBM9475933.1 hypothetical protein [Nakamurella flavida]MBM9478407.1 hypothetical protein [Nakamurella flavida]MDP9777780.1 ABC-type dipeptide/oligopeptide/nickel transport system permease component [Nakamurella flavida]